jgi:AcrR family transcriptional regulator
MARKRETPPSRSPRQISPGQFVVSNTQDLGEACIQAAIAIVETRGLEALSLREIARSLGVSHQAPYKHFASRDHVLAEIVRRAYDAFAQHLDQHAAPGLDPAAALRAMGRAYLDYALTRPLHYRLMFGTPLPDPQQHPAMLRSGQHAFNLLRACVAAMRSRGSSKPRRIFSAADIERDALLIWSTLHGLASIVQSDALHTLALSDGVIDTISEHVLDQISAVLV